MIDFIKAGIRGFARRVVLSATTFIRGSSHYDAAEDNDENRRHWERAKTEKSPQITASAPVRKKIRIRCRYEADNNCYLSGLVSTLATDVIGYTAPKLQVLTDDPELNTLIETEWLKWSESDAVNLSSKLRVLDETRRIEGESFLALINDEYAEQTTGFALNCTVISPARVTDPQNEFITQELTTDVIVDGIKVGVRSLINDDGVIVDSLTGRPVEYRVAAVVEDYTTMRQIRTVSARYLLQWFCPRRPGQFRGVCELAPALPLYAQLRRYGLATLSAAEIAAMFAGVMTTQVPPGEEPPVLTPGFKLELERGMLVAMPEGSDARQFEPKQPISSYEMFVNMILREIGRTLDVPFGIVAGDSSKYNYSSAQLDYRGYEERLTFDKKQLLIRIQNPLYREWLLEFATINTKVRQYLNAGKIAFTWHFSRRPSSDPVKDATADDMRLKNGTTNYAEIYAAKGMDYEEQWDQREKENKMLEKKMLVFPGISGTMEGTDKRTDDVDKIKADDVQSTDLKDAARNADVQQTSLNGAQIASMQAIAAAIANGEYNETAGVLLYRIAFPLADTKLLQELVKALVASNGVTEPVKETVLPVPPTLANAV